jgi:hypothetical protein
VSEVTKWGSLIDDFIAQWCEIHFSLEAEAQQLWEAYQVFCDENAVSPKTQVRLGKHLTDLGFERARSRTGKRVYLGIGLLRFADKPTENGSTVDIPDLTDTTPDIDRLIDRILQRQERRTPGYVLRSQAMQRILVRLDTALEADEATLRAEVAAVIEDLGSVIAWEG